MARIRTIKPEFWTSEQIVECSRDARLLFIGLWNFCDDQGVHPNSERTIRARVFPGDDDVTSDVVRRLIAELVSNGLVGVYEVDGIEYLHVLGWTKHQKIERPNAKHPKPPRDKGGYLSRSSNHRRTIPGLFDVQSPPEGKGMESNGREGKGRERGASVEFDERSTTGSENSSGKANRGTRIQPDWEPSAEVVGWAASQGFDSAKLDRVLASFRDYWRAAAGSKGVKLDWDATFRNWLRRESADAAPKSNGHNPDWDPDPEARKWRPRVKDWVERKFWSQGAYGCAAPPSREFFQLCPSHIAAEFGLRPEG